MSLSGGGRYVHTATYPVHVHAFRGDSRLHFGAFRRLLIFLKAKRTRVRPEKNRENHFQTYFLTVFEQNEEISLFTSKFDVFILIFLYFFEIFGGNRHPQQFRNLEPKI